MFWQLRRELSIPLLRFMKTLRLKRLSPQVPVVVRRNRLVLTGGGTDMPQAGRG
jgi:hypothetical protein